MRTAFSVGPLDLRVERGLHLQAALVEGGGAVLGLQVLADVLGEVGGEHLLGLLGGDQERLRDRLSYCARGDVALLEHAAQHAVAVASAPGPACGRGCSGSAPG